MDFLFNNKLSELVSQIREIINNYELFLLCS